MNVETKGAELGGALLERMVCWWQKLTPSILFAGSVPVLSIREREGGQRLLTVFRVPGPMLGTHISPPNSQWIPERRTGVPEPHPFQDLHPANLGVLGERLGLAGCHCTEGGRDVRLRVE